METNRRLRVLLKRGFSSALILGMLSVYQSDAFARSCEEIVGDFEKSAIAEIIEQDQAASEVAGSDVLGDFLSEGETLSNGIQIGADDMGAETTAGGIALFDTDVDESTYEALTGAMASELGQTMTMAANAELKRSKAEADAALKERLEGVKLQDPGSLAEIGLNTMQNSELHEFNSQYNDGYRLDTLDKVTGISDVVAEIGLVVEKGIDTSDREAVAEALKAIKNPDGWVGENGAVTRFFQSRREAASDFVSDLAKIRITLPGAGRWGKDKVEEFSPEEAKQAIADENTDADIKRSLVRQLQTRNESLDQFIGDMKTKIEGMIREVDSAKKHAMTAFNLSIKLEHQLVDDYRAIAIVIKNVEGLLGRVDKGLAEKPNDPKLLAVKREYEFSLATLKTRLSSKEFEIQSVQATRSEYRRDFEMYVTAVMGTRDKLDRLVFQLSNTLRRIIGSTMTEQLVEAISGLEDIAHRLSMEAAEFQSQTAMSVEDLVHNKEKETARLKALVQAQMDQLEREQAAQANRVEANRRADTNRADINDMLLRLTQGTTLSIEDVESVVAEVEEDARAEMTDEEAAARAEIDAAAEAVETSTDNFVEGLQAQQGDIGSGN